MKKIILCSALFILYLHALPQSGYYISGRINDAATKAPMQAASVFAQNTTLGTATAADGNFKLWLPDGGYDLIITFTGYETVTKRITGADNNITIEMKLKEKSMEEVAIRTSNEVKDGWLKYGDFFIENFIGKTANSAQCSIDNPTALKFYFSKKRNRLKVLAEEPVNIINKSLGYTIKYTLDSFVYDYNSNTSLYAGYALFEEILVDSATNWHAARMKAYKGSVLHFMRSVFNKQLKEQGFEIQLVANNRGQDTILRVKDAYGALGYSKDDSTQTIDILPTQPDVAVLYKNEMPEEAYSNLNPEAPKKFQLSVMNINIAQQQTISIEQNGFYYDQTDINFTGYWAWEKIAELLPYDFKPE